MQILYVEDDAGLSKSVQAMLRIEGHDCHATEMGEEAVALAEQNEYDIIVLDIMLPDIDGYEVIQRARSAGVKTPFLIQSALADPDSELNGFGFDEYLAKPFNKSQLMARMETVLAQAREGGHSTPVYTQDWARMEWDTSDERRQSRRFMTRKFAFLTKDDNRETCIVINMSKGGAALKLSGSAKEHPSRFELRLRSGIVHQCEVCWRLEDKMGVRFV